MNFWFIRQRFRPLTGINFNYQSQKRTNIWLGFRPLTGINFNLNARKKISRENVSVPSRG